MTSQYVLTGRDMRMTDNILDTYVIMTEHHHQPLLIYGRLCQSQISQRICGSFSINWYSFIICYYLEQVIS